MAIVNLSFDNSSSALFYPEFKSIGVSPLFIGMNAAKSTVAGIGILLNLSLLLVTILSKSLHGSCNLLLAIDSLTSILYGLSPFPSLFISITGQNFMPLSLCFLLQFVPILGVNMAFALMLFIAIERAASICFPLWFNRRNPKYYLPAMIGFGLLMAAINLYDLATVQSANIMVMCSLPDCYRGEPGQVLYRNGLATICVALGCYALIWFQMRRSLAKNKGKVNQATRRMFKSLVLIISSMFFGWTIDIVVRMVLPLVMVQSTLGLLALSNILSNCSFIAAGSNPIILYAFSKDYHAAYNIQANRFFKFMGITKWHMNSAIDVATIQPTHQSNGAAVAHARFGARSASVIAVGPGLGWALGKEEHMKQMRSVSLKEGKLTQLG